MTPDARTLDTGDLDRCKEIVARIGNAETNATAFDVARKIYDTLDQERPQTLGEVTKIVWGFLPKQFNPELRTYEVVAIEHLVWTIAREIEALTSPATAADSAGDRSEIE